MTCRTKLGPGDMRNLFSVNPETRALLTLISTHPLPNFILVGGTGLAAHIGHRDSYDVDLAFPKHLGGTLPRADIDDLLEMIKATGAVIQPIRHIVEEQNFINDGLQLDDYQRDFTVDDIKLQFFRPNFDFQSAETTKRGRIGKLLVATPLEILWMKSGVTAERLRSRDAFDLGILISRHQFGLSDYLEGLHRSGQLQNAERALTRLAGLELAPDDPGIASEHPIENHLAWLRNLFQSLLREYLTQARS